MKQTLKDLGLEKRNEHKSASAITSKERKKLKIEDQKVHDRTKGDIIVVQPDSLALFIESVKNHARKKAGMFGSAGISLSLLLALLTNQAKDFLGISAATWQSTFLLGLILFIGLTIREGWGFFTSPLWNKDPVKEFLKDPLFKEIPKDVDDDREGD